VPSPGRDLANDPSMTTANQHDYARQRSTLLCARRNRQSAACRDVMCATGVAGTADMTGMTVLAT